MIKKRYLSLFILLFLYNIDSILYAQPALSPPLQRVVTQSNADNAFWSIMVRNADGDVIESYNADKLVRPASNLKLLTSATVLHGLGPGYTYKTHLYGVGRKVGNVWQGDLIFRGSGDPSISGQFYNDDRLHVFDEFITALETRGIEKIEGNIIGNDSFFDDQAYPEGWSWDDLSFYYAAPINALSFNNNTVDLTVRAHGAIGSTPAIEWFPFDTDYVHFINEQDITPANAEYDEYYHRLLGTNTIILGSNIPRGYIEKEALTIQNPPLYFIDTFKKYAEMSGIEVDGHLMVDNQVHDWDAARYQTLGMHVSPPLSELLKQLNKESDNFYAEMLLKTVAAERYNTQGTTDLGIALMKEFGRARGLEVSDLEISDASGMSPTTLFTTRDITQLLVSMQRHRYFETFKNSLPISGLDGSLEYRFRHSPLEGRIHAKTGYISGVRAISGYMQTQSDKTVIFSIVTNHYTSSTSYIDSLHESLLEEIYVRY